MNTRPLLLLSLFFFGCAQHSPIDPLAGRPSADGDSDLRPEVLVPLSSQEFAALEKRAAAGDVKAQYEVGARYAEGFGVRQDASKGLEWLSKAAQRGETRAERRVGFMLVNGEGTPADLKQGLEWLNRAAEAGNPEAQSILGQAYLHGTSVPRDDHKAFELLFKLAQRGAPIPQTQIGSMYATGRGVPQDWKAACEWWEKAAAKNNPEALRFLAQLYLSGDGVEKDPKAGMSLLIRASCLGELDAERLLSLAYLGGTVVPKDLTRGVDLLEAAARAGSAGAQNNYAALLATDTLGPPDYAKTRVWLARAAAQGDATAQKNLGILYDEGAGGAADPVEALKWFQLAADQGNQEAAARQKEALVFATPAQAQEAKRRAAAFKPEVSRPVPDDAPAAECPLLEGFRIPVRILGQTNYLVVDTGATLTMLDPTNRPSLGEPLAQDKMVTAFQKAGVALYNCPEMFVGGRRFAPLWTGCASFAQGRMALSEPCDGLIGMLCLRNYMVTFDPDNGRFLLGGTVPEAVRTNALAMPFSWGPDMTPVIKATINGVGPIDLTVDSGNNAWIDLCQQDWRRVFPHGEPTTIQRSHVGVGDQSADENEARVQSVSIGTNQYKNLIVSAGKALPFSYLGQRFIARHTCVIDFPNQVLYLLPGKRFLEPDEDDMSGLTLVRQSGKTVLYGVDKGSPAYRAGARENDEVMAINGQGAASLKLGGIRDMLRSGPGVKIEMNVLRQGKPLRFTFVLKRVI